MKHNFHEFRKNKQLKLQNNFIFVDTESNNNQISKEKEILTFKLGCAVFWNRKDNNVKRITFFNINTFWSKLESCFNKKNRELILYAHNTQFDFKMLNGFKQLLNRGWILKSHYIKNKIFILVFKKLFAKGKSFTLHIWDTMNYAPEKLETIGLSIGFSKLHIDFNNVSNKELIVYCKRDTEIIYLFIRKLIEFLDVNDLSRLKATAGSLSFNSFRHRFYNPDKEKDKIYIHDWKKAIKLERESYRGGISDCFKLGKQKHLYKLDINSMYSKTMKDKLLPNKLLFYSHESNYSQKDLFKIYKRSVSKGYGLIMKITVSLPSDNAYILNNFGNNKSMFGFGTFKVSVCSPEIEFIEKYGKILRIHEINVYRMETIFKDFVSFFYDLKIHYKKTKNSVNEKFCKLMLNTQYGKWGQRNIEYVNLTINHEFLIEYQEVIKLMILSVKKKLPNLNLNKDICYLGCIITKGELYMVNGNLFLLKQTNDNSKDSFVAIASFITSYSRMLLIKYLKIAKRKNVSYCDTDSLFVNYKGYNNLKANDCINEFKLGKLKLEGKGSGTFYAPKFYDFNELRKCKGVKKESVILLENNEKVVYEVQLWQKFKSDLKLGYINEQVIRTTTKQINKLYNKGKVDDLGNVYPFSVKEILVSI